MRDVSTAKSIITGNSILIKFSTKYALTDCQFKTLKEDTLVKATYRRLVRLRPFISKRQMVKNSYTEYLRYKFKVEDYELKRKLILSKDELKPLDIRVSLKQSFHFVLKAISVLDVYEKSVKAECTTCRRVLKNILTADYHKNRSIHRSAKLYQYYKKNFGFINDKQKIGLGQFEENLLRLNETLGTRL